jgi:hypothetical protein
MSSLGDGGRTSRTCVRCGRIGSNAFERVADVGSSRSAWACTHAEPCAARRRSRWRADERLSRGRPKSSPLLAWTDERRQSCVIGADPAAVSGLEQLLRELTPLDVEALDPSPRSLSRLSRGTYSVVVVDTDPSDPLAYCNEVYRRLSSTSRRLVPIVICSPPNQPIRPPIRKLVGRPNVRIVERPMRPDDLVSAVSDALRSSGVDAGAAR